MTGVLQALILAIAIEVGILYGGWHGVAAFVALTAIRAALAPSGPRGALCTNCKFYRADDGGKMVCYRFIEPIVGGYHMPDASGYCSEGKRKDA